MESKKGKQFMPFDPLEGFKEKIKEHEIVYVDKPQLSEDQEYSINLCLNNLKVGDLIFIKYYKNRSIFELNDTFKSIDTTLKTLKLEKITIHLADLLEIYTI
ncbi:MAG: hypothetical protein ACRC5M_03765 [Anaeroplasmataceae bacterium]